MSRERAFNHFLAAIDDLAGHWGHYTAYPLDETEHLGTVFFPLGLHDARNLLEGKGYERHWLAAAKFHPEPHQAIDHASYRRVPDEHPEDVDATITRDYAPAQCQYHVHCWPIPEGVYFAGHYELRSDLHPAGSEGPLQAYRRARAHYRPEYGETLLPGVTDLPFDL